MFLISLYFVNEILSELALFSVLAEKLGRLAVQLVVGGGGTVKLVKVTYASARIPDDLDKLGCFMP